MRGEFQGVEVDIQSLHPNRRDADQTLLITIGEKEGDMLHVHIKDGEVMTPVILATACDKPSGEYDHLYQKPEED